MSALLDLFGYVTVVVHGLQLTAQTVLVGSIVYAQLIVASARRDERAARDVSRVTVVAAIATFAATSVAVTLNAVVLRDSLGLTWLEVAGARFAIAGAVEAVAAALAIVLAASGAVAMRRWRAPAWAVATIVVAASLASTHAAARLTDAGTMLAATAMHEAGAAVWLGALPCFRVMLGDDGARAGCGFGRRFSAVAIAGVVLIAGGAAIFTWRYVGSVEALYGTAYGVMALAKAVLLALLLMLGLYNFRTLRRDADDPRACRRVRHVVEAEMALGFAALMAAASITSLPPATDLPDRLAWIDIRDAFHLQLPPLASPDHDRLALPALQRRLDREAAGSESRLQAYVPGSGIPPPRNAYDVAWSEYNHHWAGLVVLAMGVLALLYRSGRAKWARHWPLLFLALAAFLLVRADPEVWPLGDIGLVESLRDPEVLQHRLFVLVIAGFAIFEWRVRTGRARSRALARVFPALTGLGSVLLLGHAHALGNVREEVLVEISHVSIAVLGIAAAVARWLEIDGAETELHWPVGWIWPSCFVAVGLILLAYGEA
ncbi:MAG TPA: CopD family protein [Casimicrobiaceae bacterium]